MPLSHNKASLSLSLMSSSHTLICLHCTLIVSVVRKYDYEYKRINLHPYIKLIISIFMIYNIKMHERINWLIEALLWACSLKPCYWLWSNSAISFRPGRVKYRSKPGTKELTGLNIISSTLACFAKLILKFQNVIQATTVCFFWLWYFLE